MLIGCINFHLYSKSVSKYHMDVLKTQCSTLNFIYIIIFIRYRLDIFMIPVKDFLIYLSRYFELVE